MTESEIAINKEKERLKKKIRELKSNQKDKEFKIKKICDDIEEIVESKSNDRKFYEERLNELYQKNSHLMTNSTRINQNTKGT